MPPRIYISMFGPMPDQPTGLAMSVLRRAQTFAKAGTPTTILVDQFIPDIDRHIAGLMSGDQLKNGMIELRSMHLDLSGREPQPIPPQYISPRKDGEPEWVYRQDPKRKEVLRGYYENDYRHFVWMRSQTNVHFIDHLVNDGNIRVNRTWYDEAGRAVKIEYMNGRNQSFKIHYCDIHGNIYLEERPKSSTLYTLNSINNRTMNFQDYDSLYEYWLSNYIFKDSERPTIISEYGPRRNALKRIAKQYDAKLVYTFHSSHLDAPYTYGSPNRVDQRDFLSEIASFPALVVLTQEQKIDLEKQYGHLSNVHVIPHHAPSTQTDVIRDPNKIVLVGRFDKSKGHTDALQAFKRILDQNPGAVFEIYGRGAAENSIRNEIQELGLSNSARIMGFTPDAASVFASAAVALVPSKYEGFCLSMIEAMSQGCVPVSYAFKYGPADIIRNSVDGFIVSPGNVADLADTSSLLLTDDSLRKSMSDNARDVAQRFSERKLVSDWDMLFETIRSNVQLQPI